MSNNREYSERRLTFSQRHGYESMPEPMRLEEISDALRREIWNETRQLLKSMPWTSSSFYGEGALFIERILGKFLKRPEDEIVKRSGIVFDSFKRIILNSEFNTLLDFIEIILYEAYEHTITISDFPQKIYHIFDVHAAAYWLDLSCFPYKFFPRSDRAQGEATRSAIETLRENGMEGAGAHLRQAAAHINAGQFADSIADSIHAVESVARTINPKAKTLGPALDSLQKSGLLKHHALKEAFSKLYGYTSDEQGIRHSLLDKASPDVDLDEAMFMFGACASFAAYLVNKHRKVEQLQGSDQ